MKIAQDARLFLMPAARGGARVVRGFVLEIGPDASADAIATIACRRMLALEFVFDESAVVRLVSDYGFVYTGMSSAAPAQTAAALARMAS